MTGGSETVFQSDDDDDAWPMNRIICFYKTFLYKRTMAGGPIRVAFGFHCSSDLEWVVNSRWKIHLLPNNKHLAVSDSPTTELI